MGSAKAKLWLVLVIVFLVVSIALSSAAFLEGGALEPRAPSSSGPSPMYLLSAPATYDAADGYDLWHLSDGSTWTYAHGVWSNITSAAGTPTNMENNVRMVDDTRDGYVLLFGGVTASLLGHPLADSWAFRGGHWTNITGDVRGSPPPRLLGLMTYDSEDQLVVLFGGSSPTGGINETWTYAEGIWTNATVPGPPSPGGSYDLPSIYGFVDDRADGYVLYYNPFIHCPGGPCSIAWTYRGGVWTNRTASSASSPHLDLLVAFAYDSTQNLVLAQSVCSSTPTYTCAHRYGTFVFSGGAWRDVTTATEPSGRYFSSWVDDPSDGGVLVVGGCCWADFSGLSLWWQDAWIYSNGTWTESEPWEGGPASWDQNDGTWVGFGVTSVSVVVVVFSWRNRVPRLP